MDLQTAQKSAMRVFELVESVGDVAPVVGSVEVSDAGPGSGATDVVYPCNFDDRVWGDFTRHFSEAKIRGSICDVSVMHPLVYSRIRPHKLPSPEDVAGTAGKPRDIFRITWTMYQSSSQCDPSICYIT